MSFPKCKIMLRFHGYGGNWVLREEDSLVKTMAQLLLEYLQEEGKVKGPAGCSAALGAFASEQLSESESGFAIAVLSSSWSPKEELEWEAPKYQKGWSRADSLASGEVGYHGYFLPQPRRYAS